jgi:hypothetical protein
MSRSWSRNWPVILTACFAVVWIVHRALVQSITLDEATTFRLWVSPDWPSQWTPQSNNHVLNSILMRMFIWLFGLSHLTVRTPAILGGILYIFSIYRFCTILGRNQVLTWALFVCFVYNPFIMDYLVVARGYGLALGFLSLAMYLFARALVRLEEPSEREILKHAMAISACAALSLSANFSFAYASAFLFASFLAWACLEQRKRGWTACARLAFDCTWPAVVIVFMLTGSVLAAFPRSELIWGVHSWAETWQDMRDATFAELNPYLVNPLVAGFLRAIQLNIVGAAAAAAMGYLVLVVLARRPRYFHARSRLLLASALAATLVLTLLAHWLQFKLLKIPLPYERTSIFFVPLATALVGAILSVAPSNLAERVVRGFGVVVLCVTGIYFIGTLRDAYFREWRLCADLKVAFPEIRDLCHRIGVREVACDLNYTSTLDLYRTLYKVNDLEFPDIEKMPSGKPIYVLPADRYGDFIRKEGLQVAYHGPVSDLVILVRRGVAVRANPLNE